MDLIDDKFEEVRVFSALENREPSAILDVFSNHVDGEPSQILSRDMHVLLSHSLCTPSQRISSQQFLNSIEKTLLYRKAAKVFIPLEEELAEKSSESVYDHHNEPPCNDYSGNEPASDELEAAANDNSESDLEQLPRRRRRRDLFRCPCM